MTDNAPKRGGRPRIYPSAAARARAFRARDPEAYRRKHSEQARERRRKRREELEKAAAEAAAIRAAPGEDAEVPTAPDDA